MKNNENGIICIICILCVIVGIIGGFGIGQGWTRANAVQAGVGKYKSVGNWGKTEFQWLTKEFIIFDHEFEENTKTVKRNK